MSCLLRAGDAGESFLEHGHDLGRVVDGECGLRDVGEVIRLRRSHRSAPTSTVSMSVTAPGSCPVVPSTSGCPGMSDQQHVQSVPVVAGGLHMYLRDQGAGGIDCEQIPKLGGHRHGLRLPMCRKDHWLIRIRYLIEFFPKYGAFGASSYRRRSGCERSHGER